MKKKENTAEAIVPARYTKEQLFASDRYREERDLIAALLIDERSYSVYEADHEIKKYLKGKVK